MNAHRIVLVREAGRLGVGDGNESSFLIYDM